MLDANRHWKWATIMDQMAERFSLATEVEVLVALWCGARRGPLRLPRHGRCYRLDYFEIDPLLRGGDLGTLAFALACERAIELGATGLVLGAIPELERWYRAHGGVSGPIQGWSVERDLLPFFFPEGMLRTLVELADGYVEG